MMCIYFLTSSTKRLTSEFGFTVERLPPSVDFAHGLFRLLMFMCSTVFLFCTDSWPEEHAGLVLKYISMLLVDIAAQTSFHGSS